MAIRYASFDDALRAATVLGRSRLSTRRSSARAKEDVIWTHIAHLVGGDDDPGRGDQSRGPARVDAKVDKLTAFLDAERK